MKIHKPIFLTEGPLFSETAAIWKLSFQKNQGSIPHDAERSRELRRSDEACSGLRKWRVITDFRFYKKCQKNDFFKSILGRSAGAGGSPGPPGTPQNLEKPRTPPDPNKIQFCSKIILIAGPIFFF